MTANPDGSDELEPRLLEQIHSLQSANEQLRKELASKQKTEAALHENEERFRHYFELGLIGMAITSPTKGCLEVNDRVCEILGYERSERLASRGPSI
jgi:PAS domain-containing protein